MDTSDVLLQINNLHISIRIKDTYYDAVDHVSLQLKKNEVFAIVGESGCGKSTLATSIIGLHDSQKVRVQGELLYKQQNLATLDEVAFTQIRGEEIGMIFQDPLGSLNPLMRIGDQIEEVLIYHTKLNKRDRRKHVEELLKRVGFPNPEKVIQQFPHQLSGGMRQRVVISIAIACKPALLIADEPTTALDVTIQAQILDLLLELQRETEAAILFITHDLGVVAEIAQRVAVMYAGQIIEEASVEELFENPLHPYTRLLLQSIPPMHQHVGRLNTIQGMVPSLIELPRVGCRFSSRISWMGEEVHEKNPKLREVSPGHFVRCTCWKYFNSAEEA